MIREARDQSTGMVGQAQQQKQAILGELGQERDLLQKKIAELRSFERDYRARLKSYLESQLHDLESAGGDQSGRPEASDGRPGATRDEQGDAQEG